MGASARGRPLFPVTNAAPHPKGFESLTPAAAAYNYHLLSWLSTFLLPEPIALSPTQEHPTKPRQSIPLVKSGNGSRDDLLHGPKQVPTISWPQKPQMHLHHIPQKIAR